LQGPTPCFRSKTICNTRTFACSRCVASRRFCCARVSGAMASVCGTGSLSACRNEQYQRVNDLPSSRLFGACTLGAMCGSADPRWGSRPDHRAAAWAPKRPGHARPGRPRGGHANQVRHCHRPQPVCSCGHLPRGHFALERLAYRSGQPTPGHAARPPHRASRAGKQERHHGDIQALSHVLLRRIRL